ncbi:MAG: ABC transporter permease [Chloroflexaceae bacterium]|jgi:NitT/TauT family transport system permease protein|nr:ABC transporter permease [Chloroflexaceae bacterium]
MHDDAAISAPTRPTAPSARRRVKLPLNLGRALPVLGVVAGLLLLWEAVKFLFGISDQRLPHVADVVAVFFTRTQGGTGPLLLTQMLINAWATFQVALSGFIIGGVLGFALALLFTWVGTLERGCLPFVIGSQTVPILAIAPMVVIGLGQVNAPEWAAKAVVAAYLTFFPVTIGMLRGLRATPPAALDLMRSYAASPLQVFFKLRLPSSLPYLFTSLKVAATASVIGAIVAELPAAAQRGIGLVILNAAQFYNSRPPALYAAILVAGLVGLAFYGLVVLAEKLIVRNAR